MSFAKILVYEFLIFNKSGLCLYHADFTGSLVPDTPEKERDIQER